MQFKPEYLFYVVFAAVAGSMLFKALKHGGFKGAMFGAGIRKTVGEVSGNGPKLMSLSLKVHELDGEPNDKALGLELVAKSFASYQTTPITLSVTEAKKLADLIYSVTGGKQNT